MAAALAPIQAKGLQVLPYLEDSHSQEQEIVEITQLLFHIAWLGLAVNFGKNQLTPTQSVKFIGVILVSQLMIASLSEQRVNNILQLLQQFQTQARLPFRYFLRLMGMLAAVATVILLGLLSLCPSQRWVNNLHLKSSGHRNKLIKVTQQCLLTLKPWRRRSYLTKGVALCRIPFRREVVQIDASFTAWGTVWQQSGQRAM